MQHASKVFQLFCALLVPSASYAQINSGSDGRDGVFEPTTSIVVDMSDHPTGIYHYTRVNIPAGVNVTFKPNARNTPVIWLVQTECLVRGVVDVSGLEGLPSQLGGFGGLPGPGGFGGGSGGRDGDNGPSEGSGPGGGRPGTDSFSGKYDYGNPFLLPLLGGSGGAGGHYGVGGGGGGGGAILIAANELIEIAGSLKSKGGAGFGYPIFPGGVGGGGSGGAIRLVTSRLAGNGGISTQGGQPGGSYGRVRIDALEDRLISGVDSQVSRGFNSIIIQPAGLAPKVTILSLAGVNVVEDPQGRLASPDVVLPAQVDGRLAVVVRCENLPLGSEVTVDAKPVSGLGARAVGRNTVGKIESSTATLTLNLPRGVGTIMARAVASVASPNGQSLKTGGASTTKTKGEGAAVAPKGTASLADIPYSVTGLTTDGERIAAIEAEGTLGGPSRTVYVTESGKRISTTSAR